MKRIELVIETQKVGEVRDALSAIGVEAVTTKQIRGDDRPEPGNDLCGQPEFLADAVAETSTTLEIVVSAERAAQVIQAFTGSRWRRLIGDGKMFVYEVSGPPGMPNSPSAVKN
jgi:nitrogen regulatory protein PII